MILEMTEAAKYLDVNSTLMMVIQKCGRSVGVAPLERLGIHSQNIQLINLTNVGRNDHSYAWALRHLGEGLTAHLSANASVFLLKDNMMLHQPEMRKCKFSEVLADLRSHGFGCFFTMQEPATDFHLVAGLGKFNLSEYKGVRHYFRAAADQRPLNKWWDSLGIMFGNRNGSSDDSASVIQVCYGGNFAVRMDNIRAVNYSLWPLLVARLARNDSIEEGHYAERTWAGLLAQSTPPARLTVCDPAHRSYPGRMCSKKS
ncbi:unnamed protein product [Prorocentrum cordatum]|uniref:Uncharacterized protein n=1 Tax=Prorocentrum cordatum TaxID=2364126 RepID=A0ABN9QWK1_9DINO|nr:unnamed protein product [Polarella glacialis]